MGISTLYFSEKRRNLAHFAHPNLVQATLYLFIQSVGLDQSGTGSTIQTGCRSFAGAEIRPELLPI